MPISVTNSGHPSPCPELGIPPALLPQLFERFTASSSSEVQAGSGIGLALAKELTALHGGTISVKSRNQEGSVFTVSFPISKDAFTPEQIVESKDALPVSDFAASLSSYPEPIKSSFGDLVSTVDKIDKKNTSSFRISYWINSGQDIPNSAGTCLY